MPDRQEDPELTELLRAATRGFTSTQVDGSSVSSDSVTIVGASSASSVDDDDEQLESPEGYRASAEEIAHAMSSARMPSRYPAATETNVPTAYLRPMREPLYDCELVPVQIGAFDVRFFQRQVGNHMQYAGVQTKSALHTNLNLPGQLDAPTEFSVLGFNILLEKGIGVDNINVFVNSGVFSFTFSGNRIWLQDPLIHFVTAGGRADQNDEAKKFLQEEPQSPATAAQEEAFAGEELIAALRRVPKNGAAQSNPVAVAPVSQAEQTEFELPLRPLVQAGAYYRFNIGRAALRLRSGESFGARISFPEGLRISRSFKVWVTIEGIYWRPM